MSPDIIDLSSWEGSGRSRCTGTGFPIPSVICPGGQPPQNLRQQPQPWIPALLVDRGSSPATRDAVRLRAAGAGFSILKDPDSPCGMFLLETPEPEAETLRRSLYGKTGIAGGTFTDRYFIPISGKAAAGLPADLDDAGGLPELLEISRENGCSLTRLDCWYLVPARPMSWRDPARLLSGAGWPGQVRFLVLEFPEG